MIRLILLVVLVCGCQSTKRDVEIGVNAPLGAPDKAKMTATFKTSF